MTRAGARQDGCTSNCMLLEAPQATTGALDPYGLPSIILFFPVSSCTHTLAYTGLSAYRTGRGAIGMHPWPAPKACYNGERPDPRTQVWPYRSNQEDLVKTVIPLLPHTHRIPGSLNRAKRRSRNRKVVGSIPGGGMFGGGWWQPCVKGILSGEIAKLSRPWRPPRCRAHHQL